MTAIPTDPAATRMYAEIGESAAAIGRLKVAAVVALLGTWLPIVGGVGVILSLQPLSPRVPPSANAAMGTANWPDHLYNERIDSSSAEPLTSLWPDRRGCRSCAEAHEGTAFATS